MTADERLTALSCPNCGDPDTGSHPEGCFLNMLMDLVSDRGGQTVTREDRQRVFGAIDIDYLWETFGDPATEYINSLTRS